MPAQTALASTRDTRQLRIRSRAVRLTIVAVLSVVLLALTPLPAQAQNPGCGPTDKASAELLGFYGELDEADVAIATDAKGVSVVSTEGKMFGYYDYKTLTVRSAESRYVTLGAVTSDGNLIGWGLAPGHSLGYDGCTATTTNALTLIIFYGRPQLDLTSMAATDAG